MQGSDKMERRTPYLLQHACCVMIANAALGNLWVPPDFFQFIPWAGRAEPSVEFERMTEKMKSRR